MNAFLLQYDCCDSENNIYFYILFFPIHFSNIIPIFGLFDVRSFFKKLKSFENQFQCSAVTYYWFRNAGPANCLNSKYLFWKLKKNNSFFSLKFTISIFFLFCGGFILDIRWTNCHCRNALDKEQENSVEEQEKVELHLDWFLLLALTKNDFNDIPNDSLVQTENLFSMCSLGF